MRAHSLKRDMDVTREETPSSSPLGWWVGILCVAVLWLAPTERWLGVASLLLMGWAIVRARARVRSTPWLAVVASALVAGVAVWDSGAGTVLGAAVALGVFPLHLWVEELRRRLPDAEFGVFMLGQLGVAWLHRAIQTHPGVVEGPAGHALLLLCVASALLHAAMALVRREASAVLTSMILAQSSLVAAGTCLGEVGWIAARTMLLGTVVGGFVLLSLARELRRSHHADTLDRSWGLAAEAPDLHRLFVTAGWLFVGLPGGLAFFAEDLLFHALIEHSVGATLGFVVAGGLNAVAFYRLYTVLFCGLPVVDRAPVRIDAAGRRLRVRLWAAAVGLLILGGWLPFLLVHG